MFLAVFAASSTPLKRGLMIANGVSAWSTPITAAQPGRPKLNAQLHGGASAGQQGERIM